MLRSLFGSLCHSSGSSARLSPAIRPAAAQHAFPPFRGGGVVLQQQQQSFATLPQVQPPVYQRYRPAPVALEDMPFLHHGKRPRYTNYKKFIMPRKRAYKMMEEITHEAVAKAKAARPAVYESNFQVGDAIEVVQMKQGFLEAKKTETLRGVVMGIFRKRLDTWILIRKYCSNLFKLWKDMQVEQCIYFGFATHPSTNVLYFVRVIYRRCYSWGTGRVDDSPSFASHEIHQSIGEAVHYERQT